MKVVIHIGGGLVYKIFVRGSVYIEGCSEDFMYLFLFFLFLDTLFMYLRSCDHIVIETLYLLIYIHLRLLLQFFHLSLYTCFLYIVSNL